MIPTNLKVHFDIDVLGVLSMKATTTGSTLLDSNILFWSKSVEFLKNMFNGIFEERGFKFLAAVGGGSEPKNIIFNPT